MANTAAYARWLAERRREVVPRLSQSQLADMIGVSKNYISRLERGDRESPNNQPFDPHPEKVDAISRQLEALLNRPLVNEARATIGYPRLADEALPENIPAPIANAAPDAADVIAVVERLLRPDAGDLIPTVVELLGFPPRKRAEARRIIEALKQRPNPWACV